MMSAPQREPSTGIVTIHEEPVIFHCNHYNRFLQLTVEDCHYIQRNPILACSAADVSRHQLQKAFADHPEWTVAERLQYAESIYRYCGFGDMALGVVDPNGGPELLVRERHSHYGSALRLNYGKRRWAGEFFDLGFAVGSMEAATGFPYAGNIADHDPTPISLGGDETQILLRANEHPQGTPQQSRSITPVPTPTWIAELPALESAPERSIGLHIDEDAIIAAVGTLPLTGNEEGLIPAFGVYLTRHYADYYNLVSFRFEKALAEAMETHRYLGEMLWYEYPSLFFYKDRFAHLQGRELASTLLIEAGHICGFNTMGGIMRSDPWYQLIVPQFQAKEDWLSGIVACINALGWGIWRIVEIVPNERLVLRAWHPYESLGHLRHFGPADHPIDYLLVGVAASLMNLLYTADITEKPELTLDFYYKVNRSKEGFWGRQTRCVAMGDPYSEVVVERNIL